MERTITIETPDGPMDAFVASPGSSGPHPALVVGQEAFGVNGHIKNVCRRLAASGYLALAPELYHRSGRGVELAYDDHAAVMPIFSRLTNETIEIDLRAAFAALGEQPGVDRSRVGIIGFCMGGFAAFLAAARLRPRTAVSFYGGGIVHERPGLGLRPLIAEADRIACPVLCLFGDADRSIPPADVAAISKRLADAAILHKIVVYPSAGHGFACDNRAAFHAEAAAHAWDETLEWLRGTLGGGQAGQDR